MLKGCQVTSYYKKIDIQEIIKQGCSIALVCFNKEFYVNRLHKYYNFNYVLQAPICVNTLADTVDEYSQSLSCLCRLAVEANRLDSKLVIVNIKDSYSKLSLKESVKRLIDFLCDLVNAIGKSNITICLENTTDDIGSLSILYNVVKVFNSNKVKLCLNIDNSIDKGFNLDRSKLCQLLAVTEIVKYRDEIPNVGDLFNNVILIKEDFINE